MIRMPASVASLPALMPHLLLKTMIRFSSGPIALPTQRLIGQRVLLRVPRAEDWPAWAALREESRDFLVPWEPLWPADALTRGAFLRRLKRQQSEWREDVGYHFLVVAQEGAQLVGGIALTQVRRGVAQSGTLGYWVGQPFRRRGYIAEAVRLMLDFAFDHLALHRVEAACMPSNGPSRALLVKAGLREEGYLRGYLRINGQWADHVLYAILKDEHRR